jgi:hypothetical protein
VLAAAFHGSGDKQVGKISAPPPRVLEYATLGLALVSLVLGLASSPMIELLQIGSPWPEALVQEAGS